jgi:hypothetical protein
VQGVADWKPPRTVRDVRAFLGFTGYYRYFIKDYSKIARPLIHLTKKATPFTWEEAQVKAFETLKEHMCRNPILRQPDYTKPFFLATDTSAYGVGAVLLQEGDKHPRKNLTNQTPHSLLLRNVHPNRAQLRHLREGTPGTDESPSPLAPPPSRVNNPSHGPHRPHKPNLLEIPTQGKPPRSTMVRRTPGIPSEDPTRAREAPHLGRPPLPTPRSGQRRDRQPGHNPPRPGRLHRTNHHQRPQGRMVGAGATDRRSTTEIPRRSHTVDQTSSSDKGPLTQQWRPETLACTRKNRHPTGRHPEKGNPSTDSTTWRSEDTQDEIPPSRPSANTSGGQT